MVFNNVKIIMKFSLIISLLLLISCEDESVKLEETTDYAKLVKLNVKKVEESMVFKNYLQGKAKVGSNNEKSKNYFIDDVTLQSLLNQTNLSTQDKKSLNIEQVNNMIKEIVEVHKSGTFGNSFENTGFGVKTKNAISKLITDGVVQEASNFVDMNSLTSFERGSLLMVNDLTNDSFSNNLYLNKGCNITGPGGSGSLSCGVAFAVIGAVWGGASGSLGGAAIGAIAGFLVGSIIDVAS